MHACPVHGCACGGFALVAGTSSVDKLPILCTPDQSTSRDATQSLGELVTWGFAHVLRPPGARTGVFRDAEALTPGGAGRRIPKCPSQAPVMGWHLGKKAEFAIGSESLVLVLSPWAPDGFGHVALVCPTPGRPHLRRGWSSALGPDILDCTTPGRPTFTEGGYGFGHDSTDCS